MSNFTLLALAPLALLAACAAGPETAPMPASLSAWSERDLPGKRSTDYSYAQRGGQACVLAQPVAAAAASAGRAGQRAAVRLVDQRP
jgi:hypothetical protein